MEPFLLPQRCTFPPCTNSFPQLNRRKKYCSGCCRVKDFNRRNKQRENTSAVPAVQKEEKPLQESISLVTPPPVPALAAKPTEQKQGMTLAGTGESAVGTAAVLLLKDQVFDKNHRNQLQQQMNQLLQQQAKISRQIEELIWKMNQLSKEKEESSWTKRLLM